MSNAAQFLCEFFSESGEEQHNRKVRPLLEATNEVEDWLETFKAAGTKTQRFRFLVPRMRNLINRQADNELKFLGFIGSEGSKLDHAEYSLLEILAEMLELTTFADEKTLEKVRELLAAVKQLVREDDSLDVELRLFIGRTLLSIEKQLDEFAVSGEFQLREALITLFGLLHTAEAKSSNSSKWKEAWEKWGVPISQGIIVSIPQLSVGVGQMFAAIDS